MIMFINKIKTKIALKIIFLTLLIKEEVVITAKALKKSGEIVDFDPSDRDNNIGNFLLFYSPDGKIILVINEMEVGYDHKDLLSQCQHRKLAYEYILGGGKFDFTPKVLRFSPNEKPWRIKSTSSLGGISDEKLLNDIAAIITNGEEWEHM